MNPSRRLALRRIAKTVATTSLVAGAGVLGWRVHHAGLVPADPTPFEAWPALDAARPHDPLGLVGAAVLAASPHNTQPWAFRASAAQIDLFAQPQRHLGSFDPDLREQWLGLGCAVENMLQAAGGLGFAVDALQVLPSPADAAHAARLQLRPVAAAPGVLHAAIARRHTNRAAYRIDAPIAQPLLDRLAALQVDDDVRLLLLPSDGALGRDLAAGTVEATEAINADRTMSLDSHRWFRPTARDVARHRDGVATATAGLGTVFTIAGQLLPAPDDASAGAYWLSSTRRQVEHTPWFGLIAVRDLRDRRQQIAAGRLWQRFHLTLTAAGLAGQPINQMVEIVDRERQLGKPAAMAQRLARFTGTDWHATFAFRFGMATQAAPASARRPVAEVLLA